MLLKLPKGQCDQIWQNLIRIEEFLEDLIIVRQKIFPIILIFGKLSLLYLDGSILKKFLAIWYHCKVKNRIQAIPKLTHFEYLWIQKYLDNLKQSHYSFHTEKTSFTNIRLNSLIKKLWNGLAYLFDKEAIKWSSLPVSIKKL